VSLDGHFGDNLLSFSNFVNRHASESNTKKLPIHRGHDPSRLIIFRNYFYTHYPPVLGTNTDYHMRAMFFPTVGFRVIEYLHC